MPVDTETGEVKQIRPFADFLREQRGGAAHDDLSDALNELTQAVHEHGKGGTLTLTIKVSSASKGAHDAVVVTDDIKVKKPEGEQGSSVFFIDPDFNLTRESQSNKPFPGLREVPTEELTELKEAGE